MFFTFCLLPVLGAPPIRLSWANSFPFALCDTLLWQSHNSVEGTGLTSSYRDLLQMKEQTWLETARTKTHADLGSKTSDIQLSQKHLNPLSWCEVRDSTGPFMGSAGLEMHFSFHVKGRHPDTQNG